MDNEQTERRTAKIPIGEEEVALMEGIFGVKIKNPDENSMIEIIRAYLLGITHCLNAAVDRIENLEDGFIREHLPGRGSRTCWNDRGKGDIRPSRFSMCDVCKKINENRETRKQLRRERDERAGTREDKRREANKRRAIDSRQRGQPGAKAS